MPSNLPIREKLKSKFITGSKPENEVTVGFKVSDTGIGIDKDKLIEVFERFNQGEDSTTRNYGGTGLGLSIVKSLIHLQNGDIEVISEPGKGTTFHFYNSIHNCERTAERCSESRNRIILKIKKMHL